MKQRLLNYANKSEVEFSLYTMKYRKQNGDFKLMLAPRPKGSDKDCFKAMSSTRMSNLSAKRRAMNAFIAVHYSLLMEVCKV